MHSLHFRGASFKNLAGRFVFLLVCLMIITHLVIIVLFANSHKHDEYRVNRELVVQQVLHLIQVVTTTPSKQQAAVIEAIELPNVDLDLAKKPEYKLQFNMVSVWEILEHINTQHRQIQLSLKLKDGKWFNINALIVPKTWTLQLLLLSLELVLAAAVLFYLWSMNRFIVPLKRFAIAVNRLGRDLHAEPLNEMGPPDVRLAARALNNMQDKLRSLIRERTQMLAAISHDLRTPITRLKLRSQFIQDPGIRQKNLYDLDEMDAMIKDTLNFAREDSQHAKTVRFEFGSLLSSLCDDLLDVYPNQLSCQVFEYRLPMHGRPLALKRALTNIIENAIKYGNVARVKARLDANDKMVYVVVEDEGPGIIDAHIEKVFSPFFRSERSRSRETGGTGLGLAVARDIIRAHSGDVRLENRKQGGLRAIIHLPVDAGF